jgi:hypothetical protein
MALRVVFQPSKSDRAEWHGPLYTMTTKDGRGSGIGDVEVCGFADRFRHPVLKRMLIVAFVGLPLVMLATILAWVAVQARGFYYRPAAVLERNSRKIHPGMRFEEVCVVLGDAGRTIRDSQLPRTHDPDVPPGSPGRLKDVVSGESFYHWEADGGAYLIVSFKQGVVHESFFYEPSL